MIHHRSHNVIFYFSQNYISTSAWDGTKLLIEIKEDTVMATPAHFIALESEGFVCSTVTNFCLLNFLTTESNKKGKNENSYICVWFGFIKVSCVRVPHSLYWLWYTLLSFDYWKWYVRNKLNTFPAVRHLTTSVAELHFHTWPVVFRLGWFNVIIVWKPASTSSM